MTAAWLEETIVEAIGECPIDSRIPMGGISFANAFRQAVARWLPCCGFVPAYMLHEGIDDARYSKEWIEEIKSPAFTWSRGGDCDDWACFLSCLSKIPALLCFRRGSPCHIANYYRDLKGFRYFDLTLQSTHPGPAIYYQTRTFRTLEELCRDVRDGFTFDGIQEIPFTIIKRSW